MASREQSADGESERAPDISGMSPREQFERLFKRVMTAAEEGNRAQAERFLPMAFGSYQQLPDPDTDIRYDVALLHLIAGEFDQVKALADTIARATPNHLFAAMLRAEVALQQGDTVQATKHFGNFLRDYDAEIAKQRPEYADHDPALTAFRTRALAAQKK